MNERPKFSVPEHEHHPHPLQISKPEHLARHSNEHAREAIQQEEQRLRKQVQNGVAEWFRLSNLNRLPSWVRSGILLSRLLSIETASADDQIADGDPSAPRIGDATKRELSQYADTGIGIKSESITAEARPYHIIDTERLESSDPIIFENRVDEIFFSDELPASAMPTKDEGIWRVSAPTNDTPGVAIGAWMDKYGNNMTIFRELNPETQRCEQRILVEPSIGYAAPGEKPELQHMNIDLSPFGGKDTRHSFWYRELPSVDLIGGNHVYSSGVDMNVAKHILEDYGDALSRGSESVDMLFGYHQPARIILSENGDANASHSGFGMITLNTGLFLGEALSESEREHSIEEVMEHEQFHYRDNQYKLSASPEVQAVFASATTEALQELNESTFSENGYGGHAQENEKEFVASILNSIDSASWNETVQELSPEARGVYREGLRAIRDSILNSHVTKYTGIPPIVDLLSQRIEAMP